MQCTSHTKLYNKTQNIDKLSASSLTIKNMFGLLLSILIDNLSVSMSTNINVTYSNQEATKRAWAFGGLVRRFAFPPGTFIIFTPEITLPAWRDYEQVSNKKSSGRQLHNHRICDLEDGTNAFSFSKEGTEEGDVGAFKNSAIQIASPFFVYFDKLGWTHEDSIYNTPHHVASYIQEYMVEPALQIFGVPPPLSTMGAGKTNSNIQNRAGSLSKEKRKASLSETHRLLLYRKIESFLEEIGAENGKACLLRAICELNEFPFNAGRFGIFGEVLALMLGTELFLERETNQCLLSYSKAAQYGKARNCGSYAKFCQHSIFHWYWKMGQSYGAI